MLTQAAITKGTPAEFSLVKSELAALVPQGHYFADSANWRQVILHYQSSAAHKQNVFVRMDSTLATPVGNFSLSPRALNDFEIKFITIYDFDGGKYVIKRNLLPSIEFDVNIVTAPVSLFNRNFSQASSGDEFTSGTISGNLLTFGPSASYYERTISEVQIGDTIKVRIYPTAYNFTDGFEGIQVNGYGSYPANIFGPAISAAISGTTYVEVELVAASSDIFTLGALGWGPGDSISISSYEILKV